MKTSSSTKPVLRPTACSHPDCNACAREFFAWYKSRMAQLDRCAPGETSFAQAAATSNRPTR